MKSVPLTAYARTQAGRLGAKKLRTTGRVPAVIYGGQRTPQNLEIAATELNDLIHHSATENVLVDLAVDKSDKRLALVQDVQHHALSGDVLHVDLHEVAENEKVTITVPVDSTGEATGVKNGGGVLEHVLFKVKVRALPRDLPESLVVDVSHLEIGQAIHIGDIKPPAGVEVLGNKKVTVLAVAAPVTEAQEAAVLEGAGGPVGEVEMIKEKKEEGEEGAVVAGKEAAKGAPAAKAPPGKEGAKAPAGEKAADKGGEKAPADKGAEKKGEKKK
ncbi:MAG TPA: 50S ribosomal protein L25 [Verrucomicrobiae bacterium]|jgi:large subunit ribosomal protein L25